MTVNFVFLEHYFKMVFSISSCFFFIKIDDDHHDGFCSIEFSKKKQIEKSQSLFFSEIVSCMWGQSWWWWRFHGIEFKFIEKRKPETRRRKQHWISLADFRVIEREKESKNFNFRHLKIKKKKRKKIQCIPNI